MQPFRRVHFPSEAEVKFTEYGSRLAPGLQVTPFWVLLASRNPQPRMLLNGALSEGWTHECVTSLGQEQKDVLLV